MGKNINIAEFLSNCPKGTKLHSDISGNVYLQRVTKDIYVCDSKEESLKADSEAQTVYYNDAGRCIIDGKPTFAPMLFPSNKVRDWSRFNVKYAKGNRYKSKGIQTALEKAGGINDNRYYYTDDYCLYYIDRIDNKIKAVSGDREEYYEYILSTGTELKPEEEIKPKFQVGDVVKYADSCRLRPRAIDNKFSYETLDTIPLKFTEMDDFVLATSEEIKQWNEESLHSNHRHYSTSKRKIIDWFKTKDDVLVRDFSLEDSEWRLCTFSHYNRRDNTYCASGSHWEQCLPYNEKTKHLLGTTDDYKEGEL